jgi:hypothetical protein
MWPRSYDPIRIAGHDPLNETGPLGISGGITPVLARESSRPENRRLPSISSASSR